MIEAKKHYARGIDVELGVSDTGKEQVAVRFKIEGGKDDCEEIVWFGYFTDKTAERTLESLRYCGWDTFDLGDLSAEVIGRNIVQIVVEHENYQGKVYAKVAWVNKAGGPLLKSQMDDAAKREFAARMRSLAMGIDPKLAKGSPTAPTSQRMPHRAANNRHQGAQDPGFEDATFTDDDIPF